MRPHVVHLTNGRLAVRADERTLLAVPPMHPLTSREDRARILEYVLRRQIGLAHTIASDVDDHLRGVDAARARLAAMMGETPHRNQRGLAAA